MSGDRSAWDLLSVDPNSSSPLALQLSQQLTLLIAAGWLREADVLPPVRELADQLGINLNTVRAAYKQMETDGLVTSRQGRRTSVLAYDRNKFAARAPKVPSFAIGVVLANYNPFYGPLLEGIEFASGDPSMTFLCNAHDDPQRELYYLDQLIARRVDGIIVVSPSFKTDQLSSAGPPVVYVDWPDTNGPSVNFDLEGAGFAATEHLIGHGHRRIGVIGPPSDWSNVGPKLAGYQQALAEAGINYDSALVATTSNFQATEGEAAVQALFELDDPPTALFTAADTLALGTMAALASRGLAVPEDVALVSSDNISIAAVTNPPLTSVRLPARQAGAVARQMLDRLKAGDSLETESVLLSTELVIRDSCGCQEGS